MCVRDSPDEPVGGEGGCGVEGYYPRPRASADVLDLITGQQGTRNEVCGKQPLIDSALH